MGFIATVQKDLFCAFAKEVVAGCTWSKLRQWAASL